MDGDAELPAHSDLWSLVNALQRVPILADANGRTLVLRIMSYELGYQLPVAEYPQASAHLFSIVLTCADHPGGLSALLKTLDFLESRSIPMAAVSQIISQLLAGEVLLRRDRDVSGREGLLERLWQQLIEKGMPVVLPGALHGMGGIG